VEHFIQSSSIDLIETNEHDWIVFVMRFQVKDARVVGDQLLSSLESNRHRDRVRIGAAMAGLNDEYLTVDFQRGQSVISGFFCPRECQPLLADNVEEKIGVRSQHLKRTGVASFRPVTVSKSRAFLKDILLGPCPSLFRQLGHNNRGQTNDEAPAFAKAMGSANE